MNKFLKTQLQILQLEGYSPKRFLNWWIKHPLTFQLSQKTPLVTTPKMRVIKRLTYLLYILFLPLTIYQPIFLLLLLPLVIQPFPLIFLSQLLHRPYEIINRQKTINNSRRQILSNPELTVIAITGSFGKTSTKDFLYQILKNHQPTVKTPQSYNTVFGISKVIDLELTKKIRYFICEMGAYVRGEIKELTHQVPPRYAILTGIGTQHLERFKNIQNTTLAKFELIDAVEPQKALVNLDNSYIADHLKLDRYHSVHTYSLKNSQSDFYVSDYKLSPNGMDFVITWQGKNYQFNSPLFGSSNLQNLTAAIGMSFLLDLPYQTIKTAVAKISPTPNRLELKRLNQATLIDNAYSSNEQGFTQIINDLKKLKGKKALITPGIIELGNQTVNVHHQLGETIGPVFDTIYLVGHSDRTSALEQGIKETNPKVKINYLTDFKLLWPTINELSLNHDWILLENDLPDNF